MVKKNHVPHVGRGPKCMRCSRRYNDLRATLLKKHPSLKYYDNDIVDEKIDAFSPCLTETESIVKDIIS